MDPIHWTDIEKALELVVWVEVLTYYFPAIATFFYRLSKHSSERETRMTRLDRWISALNNVVNIRSEIFGLVDAAASSVRELNTSKEKILRKVFQTDNTYKIYSTLCELESVDSGGDMADTILVGKKIFEYLCANDSLAVDATLPSRVPAYFKREFGDGFSAVFSRFRDTPH